MGKKTTETASLRTAFVVGVDIVGFTKMDMHKQRDAIARLENRCLACKPVKTKTRDQDYLLLPTGDGFYLAFFDDARLPFRRP